MRPANIRVTYAETEEIFEHRGYNTSDFLCSLYVLSRSRWQIEYYHGPAYDGHVASFLSLYLNIISCFSFGIHNFYINFSLVHIYVSPIPTLHFITL